jgi:hypothetical protein
MGDAGGFGRILVGTKDDLMVVLLPDWVIVATVRNLLWPLIWVALSGFHGCLKDHER